MARFPLCIRGDSVGAIGSKQQSSGQLGWGAPPISVMLSRCAWAEVCTEGHRTNGLCASLRRCFPLTIVQIWLDIRRCYFLSCCGCP